MIKKSPEPNRTVVLTREQVRELLAEGQLCRAEIESVVPAYSAAFFGVGRHRVFLVTEFFRRSLR